MLYMGLTKAALRSFLALGKSSRIQISFKNLVSCSSNLVIFCPTTYVPLGIAPRAHAFLSCSEYGPEP